MREEFMSWICNLPDGWLSAFGEQLCDELLDALGPYAQDFMIWDCKEKFGTLRMYCDWLDVEYSNDEIKEQAEIEKHVRNIIEKYISLSERTCTHCGAPATMRNIWGWVEPLCDNCCN